MPIASRPFVVVVRRAQLRAIGEDAQQLQVEPDDRDHDAEGAGPAEGAGRAVLHALLDRVEVEHQRVGAHDDDEDADHEAERDAEDLDRAAETPRVVARRR